MLVVENPIAKMTERRDQVNNRFSKIADEAVTTDDENPQVNRSSVWGASFNFVNSIVGSGIIGIPFAILQSGTFMGIFLLAFVAFLVDKSVLMMIDCGIKTGKLDLEALCEHCLGRYGYYTALTMMFLFAYGAQVSYLVIVGDTVPLVAESIWPDNVYASRTFIMLLAGTGRSLITWRVFNKAKSALIVHLISSTHTQGLSYHCAC